MPFDTPLAWVKAYGGAMGVLGELFPGSKIQDEAGEAGDGRGWRLGPIDLDRGVVTVYRAEPQPAPDDERDAAAT
jgi:hypothetical protein